MAASHNTTITSALSRARTFANTFSIPKYYGNYQELASDANVDIVYVATTNHNHMDPTIMMLKGGKNVLVEKPTAVTSGEAKLIYDEAKVCLFVCLFRLNPRFRFAHPILETHCRKEDCFS